MERLCGSCERPFEAKRPNHVSCSPRCRQRLARGHVAKLAVIPTEGESDLVAAVRAELLSAERVDSALGQAALTLAVRVSEGRDTGSAIASMVREMRGVLAEATRNSARVDSALDDMRDELAARRRA